MSHCMPMIYASIISSCVRRHGESKQAIPKRCIMCQLANPRQYPQAKPKSNLELKFICFLSNGLRWLSKKVIYSHRWLFISLLFNVDSLNWFSTFFGKVDCLVRTVCFSFSAMTERDSLSFHCLRCSSLKLYSFVAVKPSDGWLSLVFLSMGYNLSFSALSSQSKISDFWFPNVTMTIFQCREAVLKICVDGFVVSSLLKTLSSARWAL